MHRASIVNLRFVAKIHRERPGRFTVELKHGLGKVDAGSLKIKVASSIVAISSIHLLQIFLNAPQYDNEKIMWVTIVHLAFVASALILGYLEQIMSKLK